ncbi:MAG: hypothetical protein KME60_32645 [Cyanomargarita calcarea GSE-NOS-MK-12-04C]|jgi:hypothetical protein|uniref:Uncharacterized protein n=1 Tax=Cyanomargarita calcarea GSE-NOS-MK-12-04C TaxID=2839659 RepID=A0A951QU93_9CYAN|nr:hypothetical protein [Cyanomargarita calcarea GSE-NOS-MK-12-04C]
MNRALTSILIFAFLLSFILSPFAALTGLMLVLLLSAFFFTLGDVFRVIIGGSDADSKEVPKNKLSKL